MWKQGYITIDGHTFRWEAKVYEQGSVFGIDNGRISKLWLAEYVGDPTSSMCKEAACYERGWEHRPDTPQAQAAVKQLIEKSKQIATNQLILLTSPCTCWTPTVSRTSTAFMKNIYGSQENQNSLRACGSQSS